jgi:hypothetical protein
MDKYGSYFIISPSTANISLSKPASAVVSLGSCGTEAGVGIKGLNFLSKIYSYYPKKTLI